MKFIYLILTIATCTAVCASNFDNKRAEFINKLANDVSLVPNITLHDILRRAAEFRAQMAREDNDPDTRDFGRLREEPSALVTQIGSYPVLMTLWGNLLGYNPFPVAVNSNDAHTCAHGRLMAAPWLIPRGINPQNTWHLELYIYRISINAEQDLRRLFTPTPNSREGATVWINPNYPVSQERASLINTATEQQMNAGQGGTYFSILAPAHHTHWVQSAQEIFNSFQYSSTTEDIIRQLGRIHYHLAVSAPYQRGSAAIAEMVVEALARSRGLRILYPNSHIVERIVAEHRGLPVVQARNEITSHAYIIGSMNQEELPISGRRVIDQFVHGAPSEETFVNWYQRLIRLEPAVQTLSAAVRRAIARELVPGRRLSLRNAQQVRSARNADAGRIASDQQAAVQPLRGASNIGAAAAAASQ